MDRIPEFTLRIFGDRIINLDDDNVDVEVVLGNGERFVPTFFTLRNIAAIMERHARSGESANGRYFWACDMIVVRELSIESIRSAVADLLKDDLLHKACRRRESDMA